MAKCICVPFAGAGASTFQPWKASLLPEWELKCLELPGRERRIAEPPYRHIGEAANKLTKDVMRLAGDDPQVTLFGHSMGAILAFEVCRRLESAGSHISHLVISGSAGPRVRRPRSSSELDDDAFIARVGELAGYEHEGLRFPEIRDVVLPCLRADVEMHEGYVWDGGGAVRCPVIALRGADDTLVSHADMIAWQEAAIQEIVMRDLPGGHMYLLQDARPLFGLLKSLSQSFNPSPSSP